MNIRKTYMEIKNLRKHMVNPTEQELKDYYEARNNFGLILLKYEDNLSWFGRMLNRLHG